MMLQNAQRFNHLHKRIAIRAVTTRAVAAFLFFIAATSQPSFSAQRSKPVISYEIRVDSADLSGFAVEMRVRGAGDTVRIAMASHPEYDDHYWQYVENFTAESRGATLRVTREESAVWLVVAPGGDLIVKYRIHLPPQTTPTRAAWKPFLSPTGGLIGDVHSLMYVVGAGSAPARVTLNLPNGWAIASGLDPTNDPKTFAASSVELLLVTGYDRPSVRIDEIADATSEQTRLRAQWLTAAP